MNSPKTEDPIVAEVRKAGQDYMNQFHGDMKAAMDDLRRRTRESGWAVVSYPPKPVTAQMAISAEAR